MFVFRIIYTLLLAFGSLLLAPAWIWKMRKRGGWGTGLIERLGVIVPEELTPFHHCDYYHAVSVGEVVMAVKVIREKQKIDPSYRSIIATTTATGHQIALQTDLAHVYVLYAPLDFPVVLHKVYSEIKPRRIILVDSELWPNMLHFAEKNYIPISVINGRLSKRSFERFMKIRPLIKRLLAPVQCVCTDGEVQVSRWTQLGIPDDHIYDVGSLKFDFAAEPNTPPDEFKLILRTLNPHKKPTILLSSTHFGEEKFLTQLLLESALTFQLIVVPRHAERKEEVSRELSALGVQVISRTQFSASAFEATSSDILLIDTTGELSSWLPLADVVVMGKSWLKRGGQNPFESAILGIPTICGPYMQNFEPLLSELVRKDGAIQLTCETQLIRVLEKLLTHPDRAKQIGHKGRSYLATKTGATQKTAHCLDLHYAST